MMEKIKESGFNSLEIFSSFFFSLGFNKMDLRYSGKMIDLFLFENEKYVFDLILLNLELSKEILIDKELKTDQLVSYLS